MWDIILAHIIVVGPFIDFLLSTSNLLIYLT
jgi:hypothetical protein